MSYFEEDNDDDNEDVDDRSTAPGVPSRKPVGI